MLIIVYEFDHENLKKEVEKPLPEYWVARGYMLLVDIGGLSKYIMVDNVDEFTSKLKYLNAKLRWEIYATY